METLADWIRDPDSTKYFVLLGMIVGLVGGIRKMIRKKE